MNKGLTLLAILLIGFAAGQKNLADNSNDKKSVFYYTYYYYNYTWTYYVSAAIIICVVVFIIVRRSCNSGTRVYNTSTIPLVQANYVPNQAYPTTQQYAPNQQYQSNQAYAPSQQPQSTQYVPNQPVPQQYVQPQQPQPQQYQSAPNLISTCTICNQALGPQNTMDPVNSAPMILQCTHSFHYGCIAQMMKTQNTCPICKAVIQQPQYDKPQDLILQGEVPIASTDLNY